MKFSMKLNANTRRLGALERLRVQADGMLSLIEANTKIIKEHEKFVSKDAKSAAAKLAKHEIEQLIIRNKAILAELKPINKEIAILESRVTSPGVARTLRTKKFKEFRRRRD